MKTSFWTKLLDLISPRLCVACGRRLSAEQSVLCAGCMLHMPLTGFSSQPLDNPLARLFWGQFPVERATAMFYYEPHSESAEIVYTLKYRHRPEVGQQAGQVLAHDLLAEGFFEGIDALVPVPLARKRQRQRGYNQSEEIARGISLATGLPIYNKVVERLDFKTSQTRLTPYERRENVEQAFRLLDARRIAHRHLLLVDDVITTGSIISACARQLCQAEGVRISVLALGYSRS